jgi:CRP/FNR family transcriptional regulator, anaerobic regulatory protein
MEEIFIFLESIHKLSPECLNYLRKVVKHRQVKKKDIILKIGEINQHLYFIKKGALKCFYYVDDEPVCAWFFFEGDTVVSIGSFYRQVASVDCIEALENSELYSITKQDYDYLNNTYLEFNYIARVLLEKYLEDFQTHARLIRQHKNAESYQLVLQNMPHLVNRVPVVDLASWLNMSAESLSRVRGAKG